MLNLPKLLDGSDALGRLDNFSEAPDGSDKLGKPGLRMFDGSEKLDDPGRP